MTISGNYATPITVNGYSCNNCADVSNAKKHIDPAHPKDGPYGVNAPPATGAADAPAVTFGGRLAALSVVAGASASAVTAPRGLLDISV